MSALIALAIFSLGARKTMRRLWNGIDRQLYQKAFKKQGKRVERAEQLVTLQLPYHNEINLD